MFGELDKLRSQDRMVGGCELELILMDILLISFYFVYNI